MCRLPTVGQRSALPRVFALGVPSAPVELFMLAEGWQRFRVMSKVVTRRFTWCRLTCVFSQVMSELEPAEVQYGGLAERLGDARLRPVEANLVFRLCRN